MKCCVCGVTTLNPAQREYRFMSSSDESGKPPAKIIKTCNAYSETKTYIPVRMNERLMRTDFIEQFRTHWIEQQNFKSNSCNTILYSKPFRLCVVQDFLSESEAITEIIGEMLDIEWSRKIMDLYEYNQSADISNIGSTYLDAFFKMLKTDVMPWVENLCDLKLSYVSASCSMYNCGDYLLCHDDLLNDRQVAFVYYLTPWKDVELWKDEMGGCLEIFSTDSNNLPQFPVVNRIHPRNNQFIFFKVGSQSFHQVGEVTNYDYPRLTINGWFHGEQNNEISESCLPASRIYLTPSADEILLSNWIRAIYLQENIKQDIQKIIEDKSEICLGHFFLQPVFEKITDELVSNGKFHWILKGPANSQCYEVLDLKSTEGFSKDFFTLFSSKEMFKLLYEYTDLDLDGPNAKNPVCSLEVQRWHHGSYTILGEGSRCEKSVLDIILYLNPADHAGVFTYLAPESAENTHDEESDIDIDPVLLTVSPKYNALNIVYPSEGTSRFTKYVSRKTKLSTKFVYILVCSYKE